MKNKILILCCLISIFNFVYTMENNGKELVDITEQKQINTSNPSVWINYEHSQSATYIARIERCLDYFARKNLRQIREIDEKSNVKSDGINITFNVTRSDGSTKQSTYHSTHIGQPITASYGPESHIRSILLGSAFNLPSQSNPHLIIDDADQISTNSEDDKTIAFDVKLSNDLTLPVSLTLVTNNNINLPHLSKKLLKLFKKQNKQVD